MEAVPPVEPTSIAGARVPFTLLSQLALKALFYAGQLTGQEVAQALCLPFHGVVESVLRDLKDQRHVQVKGSTGLGELSYLFAITEDGARRAQEALARSQYVGPAPVALEDYNRVMGAQAVGDIRVRKEDLREAFDGLVINRGMLDKIGPAVNSGQSIFLYGPTGNGKTTIAQRIARILGREAIYVPYAVEVGGQIITVFDESNHRRANPPTPENEGGEPQPCLLEVESEWAGGQALGADRTAGCHGGR